MTEKKIVENKVVVPVTPKPTVAPKPTVKPKPTVAPKPATTPEPINTLEPIVAPVDKPEVVPEIKVALMNTSGKEVKKEDYFFEGVILPSFEKTCGRAVDREDLLEVFNKVFNPEDNILFYRQLDKEVYLVIVPIKYSTSIGENNNSIKGDFQKHAISFLNEGSVNLEALRGKLEKIQVFVKYTDR